MLRISSTDQLLFSLIAKGQYQLLQKASIVINGTYKSSKKEHWILYNSTKPLSACFISIKVRQPYWQLLLVLTNGASIAHCGFSTPAFGSTESE